MLLGVVLASPLMGADANKILLSGSSVNVAESDAKASGAAKAIVGGTTVTADTIAFDRAKNILRCEGAVTIRVADQVITARDCTLTLSPGEKKVYAVGESVRVSPGPGFNFYPAARTDLIGSAAEREKAVQNFRYYLSEEKAPRGTSEPAR